MKSRSLLAGAFVAVLSVSGALGQTTTYKITLTASEEVPPNSSKGTGSADLTYDANTKLLKWKVTYSGLSGPATAAHIHGPADKGQNAPIVIGFENPASPIEGSKTLTDAQAADLQAGKLYINVHTAENKGGEIRGQITGGK